MMIVKRTLSSTFLVLGCIALASCSSFGGPGNDAKGRIYIGAGGLISELEPDENGVTEFTVDDTSSAGGTVFLGGDVSPRWSVEAFVSDLGDAGFEPNGAIDYQVGAVSGLVYFLNDERDRARREGFHLFGRLGVGYLENSSAVVPFDQVNGAHFLVGFGGEYGLRNGLGFRLEGTSHDEDILYRQASILYRFGSAGSRRAAPRTPAVPQTPPVNTREPAESATTAPQPVPEPAPLDSDGDGILDTIDQCNSTPEGIPIGADGCSFFSGAMEGVEFASGSDQLTPDARNILSGVVDVLNQFPQARISIGAHTDSQGNGEQNLLLSRSRAIAVTRFLVEQGIDGSRLSPRAFGETQPIQTNTTAAGRAANRRVEFDLL